LIIYKSEYATETFLKELGEVQGRGFCISNAFVYILLGLEKVIRYMKQTAPITA
jgi:hypothetical protein